MTNHPNRSRRPSPAANPTPNQVRAAREAAGLTQAAAADVIFCAVRTWQDWESGARQMHPAFFRLFLLETGQIQDKPGVHPRGHDGQLDVTR